MDLDGSRAAPPAPTPEALDALVGLDAVVESLCTLDLVELARDGLLEVVRRVEAAKRRLAVVDHALIAELGRRGVAAELSMPSTASLLRQVLRITPGEAAGRVKAAADLGPRWTLTGQTLAPLFTKVAAAQAAGIISDQHAAVITQTISKLPRAIEAEHGSVLETTLVEAAHSTDPRTLASFAKSVADYLDPDGTLTDHADHERQRELSLTRNRDGSFTLSGRLTPTCGALWQPIYDSLARPRPATGGVPDPRRAGQRMHDAHEEAARRLLTAGDLPDCGGTATTLIITMTAGQFATGGGLATTSHGDPMPASEALDLARDGQVLPVLLDPHGAILDYGTLTRIVPPKMRLAVIARDRGCTFPGCDRPPAWTQANHIQEYAAGGRTAIDNIALVCGYHHRHFGRNGWQVVMINGQPHWIPPAHVDPTRTPQRNPFTIVRPVLRM